MTTTVHVDPNTQTRDRKRSIIRLAVPRLPLELFEPIIAHISDVPTLLALCLSSQFLRHDAGHFLYHSPTLSTPTGDPRKHDTNTTLHIRFLTTITHPRNERLAALVRVYHSYEIVQYHERPLWPLLVQGLRRMTGLKSLALMCFGGHPAAEALEGCTFKLHELQWLNHSDEQWTDSEIDVHPEACPELSEFVSSRTGIEKFLLGQKVVMLAWVPKCDDERRRSTLEVCVWEALGGVRTFSFGGFYTCPHMSVVAPWLRSVEVLELVGLVDGELDVLPQIPNHREVVLSFKWSSYRLPIPLKDRPRTIHRLFSQCEKLEVVNIAHSWSKTRVISYERRPFEVIAFIEQSGFHLTRLTIKPNRGFWGNEHDTEQVIITILEHTPTLMELSLIRVPTSDALFERLGAFGEESVSAPNEVRASPFLPVLHTLLIECAMTFSWMSVCAIFAPNPTPCRPHLKIFRLVLPAELFRNTTISLSLPKHEAQFLRDARKRLDVEISISSGVDLLLYDEPEED
ncbi:unnamed protein product [Cyclocybe aegerita]|uniref:Uncharacterized protein n=1 Tax=Cyclocybe aegerita TaxID=1973307 RepID=A0A8S0WBC3_CYCAE|nr:unnamed protein product [Cyclocybe aegerita]